MKKHGQCLQTLICRVYGQCDRLSRFTKGLPDDTGAIYLIDTEHLRRAYILRITGLPRARYYCDVVISENFS